MVMMNYLSALHKYDLEIRMLQIPLAWPVLDFGILRTRFHNETPAEKN